MDMKGKPMKRPSLIRLLWAAYLTAFLLIQAACIRRFQPETPPEQITPFFAPVQETRAPATTSTPNPSPSPTVRKQATPSPEPSPSPASFLSDPSLPRSRYILSVDFDYNQHQLTVFQDLTYVNRTGESLSELVLVVETNREEGAFDLRDITWSDGRRVENYNLDGAALRIPLSQPLPPWKSVGFSISYRLEIPPTPGPFGYTARQTNLGDWYPFVPLYQADRGWLMNEPGSEGVGEYLTYDIADYEVDIQLVDSPPNLTLAASALGTANGDWHQYQLEAARHFAWSASPEFEILTDETGFVRVTSYVFPEHREAGEAATRATAAALDLYAELFMPLSHTNLSVVEAEFPDGREYDGLYFLGTNYFSTYFGGERNFLTTLAAHETSHQWWFGLVANDQAQEPWLDEALATYCEYLFYERNYPDTVDWWWEFRVSLYEPEGWVDSTIYDYESFQIYVNAVYLRGAEFLHALRETIGKEAFFNALEEYLTRNSFGQGTTEGFFQFVDAHSPADIQPLLDEYFSSLNYPNLLVEMENWDN
jgi:hypothetical protein